MIKALGYGLFVLVLLACMGARAEQSEGEAEAAGDLAAGCESHALDLVEQGLDLGALAKLNSGQFAAHQGKTIRHILYNTIDVFDEKNPDEDNRLYRLINRLHINTKPNVIRAQLLFAEGEPLDLDQIQETERILRARRYLTNAYIVPAVLCEDVVDVMVITQDAWSLEPRVSFSRKADDSESGFGINDDNIFGSGNSVTILYEEMADRNSISYSFSNPHFMNKPIAVRLSFAETSDGDNTYFSVSHPFYSLHTPWATGFVLQDVTEVNPIRSKGEIINEFRHQVEVQEVFFGSAFRVDRQATERWYVGMTKEEDSFYEIPETLGPIPEGRKAVYPWIAYEYIENRYGVYKNLNQIQRTEDLSLGINGEIRLGYGGTSLDGSDEVVRYLGRISETLEIEGRHILQMGAHLDAYQQLNENKRSRSILGGDFTYSHFISDNHRWYGKARFDIGSGLAQYEELTAGDTSGMRGYPTDFQRGDKRVLLTLERRYFSDMHLFSLVRLGAVAFVDVGRAWGLPGEESNPVLANIGIGIRLSSSKVRVGNVVHINVATPLTEQEGISDLQLLLSAQQSF